jgi:hypothetical protein
VIHEIAVSPHRQRRNNHRGGAIHPLASSLTLRQQHPYLAAGHDPGGDAGAWADVARSGRTERADREPEPGRGPGPRQRTVDQHPDLRRPPDRDGCRRQLGAEQDELPLGPRRDRVLRRHRRHGLDRRQRGEELKADGPSGDRGGDEAGLELQRFFDDSIGFHRRDSEAWASQEHANDREGGSYSNRRAE